MRKPKEKANLVGYGSRVGSGKSQWRGRAHDQNAYKILKELMLFKKKTVNVLPRQRKNVSQGLS